MKISPQEKRWNDDYKQVAEMVFGITWVVADAQLEVIAVGRRVQERGPCWVGWIAPIPCFTQQTVALSTGDL